MGCQSDTVIADDEPKLALFARDSGVLFVTDNGDIATVFSGISLEVCGVTKPFGKQCGGGSTIPGPKQLSTPIFGSTFARPGLCGGTKH